MHLELWIKFRFPFREKPFFDPAQIREDARMKCISKTSLPTKEDSLRSC